MMLVLTGCPWVGGGKYDEEVRDLDGDGGISIRFGGPDCLDDNPEVDNCDADGDGHLTTLAGGDDCDDAAGDVHPNAEERCDGVDNDCDGATDNDDADVISSNTFHVDADGDGDGDPRTTVACQEFVGNTAVYVTNDDDCNDASALIHTGATEVCDGLDNNCDGLIDDVGTWYVDADGDGFGNPGVQSVGSCDLGETTGLAATGTDCDDTDGAVFPGAVEVRYDGTDSNCNGGLDDWDADLDGHVPAAHWPAAQAANQLLPVDERWAIVLGDCDDANPERFVGNIEVCDGFDNDCDELVDVGDLGTAAPTEELTLRGQLLGVYQDLDGDGHFGTVVQICPADIDPALHALTNDDCYDGGAPGPFGSVDPALVYAGAPELCDGVDNDCNLRADWAFSSFVGSAEFYVDGDGDGFGADAVFACGAIPAEGIVPLPGDCNDGDPTSFPGAQEVCGDIVRQDCSTASIWDCDGDGQEGLYLTSGTGEDCDDEDAGIYRTDAAAFEVCDGVDNDCDGLVDSADPVNLDTSTLALWYPDLDEDGWGVDDGFPIQQCDAPSDLAAPRAGDCDDDDPALHPETPWYLDSDLDGYGALGSETIASCSPPDQRNWVRVGGDCNDLDPIYNPLTLWYPDVDGDFVGNPSGAQQFCSAPAGTRFALASAGSDCDDEDVLVQGTSTWYRDADNDGWGDVTEAIEACAQPVVSGFRYVSAFGDCEDADPTVNPQRLESCNAVDDDCDGLVDDLDPNLVASPGGPRGYQDLDQDGFGIELISKDFCFGLPPGWATSVGDCDDQAPAVYPGAQELCGNGIDDDCSGDEQIPIWYADADGDGFGAGSPSQPSCDAPAGFTATVAGDCDDAQALTFPGAIERDSCDTIDDDCDGQPEPRLTWTFDNDLDGYGDDAQKVTTCVPPSVSPIPGSSGSWVLAGGDCDDDDPGITFGRLWYADADGDGLGNDTAAFFACPVYGPGGNQLPSFLTLDENGNGLYDLGDEAASIFAGDCDDDNVLVGAARGYRIDLDGDTWGAANVAAVFACPDASGNPPTGYVTRGSDCVDQTSDDLDTHVPPNLINPSQVEILDDLADNDCDGFTDVIGGGIAWFEDLDGDGLGGSALAGYEFGAVTNSVDCDDGDATIGNGRFVYTDFDGDGYGTGNPTFLTGDCTVPTGTSAFTGDCDDANPNLVPGRTEVCDGIDQDCDGLVDEGLSVAGFADRDLDGFGDPNTAGQFCPTHSFVATLVAGADCDDFNNAIRPGALEICDGIDNNCVQGIGDEVRPLWYVDGDLDGFGSNSAFVQSCTAPAGAWLATGGDCNDGNPAVRPGVPETCNGIDDDCAGGVDDGLSSFTAYVDFDGDGAIEPGSDRSVCALPLGYTAAFGPDDCNDTDEREAPGLEELCGDGLDNDCSGVPDDQALRWVDADSDGWGWGFSTRQLAACSSPVHADRSGDCVDTNGAQNPDEPDDACNGVDNDCDTLVDEDVPFIALTPFFRDLDRDGFGDDGFVMPACFQPTGFALVGGDCDDLRDAAYPGAPELCNGLIEDCTGGGEITQAYYADLDRDGARSAISVQVCHGDTPPPFFDRLGTAPLDCNDDDGTINPSATEICDGVDNNCAGGIDESGPQYPDADNDGFGVGTLVTAACTSTTHAVEAGDCNDGNPAIKPSAPTDSCNSVDDDCDGLVDEDASFTTYYADSDDDGFGSTFLPVSSCGAPPANTVSNAQDCDDQRAAVQPGATEVCNGIDDDCNGLLPLNERDVDGDGYLACQEANDGDPNDVPGSQIWYADVDGDGFGDAASTLLALGNPGPGWVTVGTDCNDHDATMSPGNVIEYCDNKDNDCDGAVLLDAGLPVTVDVTNPQRGTRIDPFVHTDSFYAHDFDGDGTFSIDGLVLACIEAHAPSLRFAVGAPVPLQALDGGLETILMAHTDCVDGTTGTFHLADFDGDGFPAVEDPQRDLYVDCGQGPPGVPGWTLFVPGTTALDCDAYDPSRFSDQSDVYADGDQDGVISAVRISGCVGVTSAVPGDDCNDYDPSSFEDLGYWMPADQAEFNLLWNICRTGFYDVDAGALELPVGTTPTFADITVFGFNAGPCSVANVGACMNGALQLGDNSTLRLHNLGISGSIAANQANEVSLQNLVLIDTDVQISGGSLDVYDVNDIWRLAGPAFDLAGVDAQFTRLTVQGTGAAGSEGIRGVSTDLTLLDSTIRDVQTGLSMTASQAQSFPMLQGLTVENTGMPLRWDGGVGTIHMNTLASGTSDVVAGSLTCEGCITDAPIGSAWQVGPVAHLELHNGSFTNIGPTSPVGLIDVQGGSLHLQAVQTFGAIQQRLLRATTGGVSIDGLIMADYSAAGFPIDLDNSVLDARNVNASRYSGTSIPFLRLVGGSYVELAESHLIGFPAADVRDGSELYLTDSTVLDVHADEAFFAIDSRIELERTRVFMSNPIGTPAQSYVDLERSTFVASGSILNQVQNVAFTQLPFELDGTCSVELEDTTVRAVGNMGALFSTNAPSQVLLSGALLESGSSACPIVSSGIKPFLSYHSTWNNAGPGSFMTSCNPQTDLSVTGNNKGSAQTGNPTYDAQFYQTNPNLRLVYGETAY